VPTKKAETLPSVSLNPPIDVPKDSHPREPNRQEPSRTVKSARARAAAKEQTFAQWAQALKARGEKLIPDGDPIFAFADSAGIDDDWLWACWQEFRARYGDGGSKAQHKQRDWRATFRNCVRSNWFGFWRPDGNKLALTGAGLAAVRAAEGELRRRRLPATFQGTRIEWPTAEVTP